MTVEKPGRPQTTDKREELRNVSFKADAETVEALQKLVAEARRTGGLRRQSQVIRKVIVEAAARIPVKLEK